MAAARIEWKVDGPSVANVTEAEFKKNGDSMTNTMCQMESPCFQVRGKGYLEDKKKVDAGEPAFQARDIKCLAYKTGIKHIAKRLHSMRDMLAANPDSEFLIVNRMLPTTPWMNVISLFERPKAKKGEDPVFESLLESYKAASSEEKDLKLKYIVKIPNASWVVRGAVAALGGFRPVIMGKGYLDQYHYSGKNYYEVDVDVGASRVARGIMGVIVPQQRRLIIDEAFVIEGQTVEELPERLLGCYRGIKFDLVSLQVEVTQSMMIPDSECDEGELSEPKPTKQDKKETKKARKAEKKARKGGSTTPPMEDAVDACAQDVAATHVSASSSPTPSGSSDEPFHDAEDSTRKTAGATKEKEAWC